MKSGLAAILITLSGLSALPASAREAAPRPVASEELPLTGDFAILLASYRNCVIGQVDAAPLGLQADMAREAMSACALTRGELRAQLAADILRMRPRIAKTAALRSADSGLAQVDPVIEAAAVNRAHLRYAVDMI